MEFQYRRTDSLINGWEKWKARTKSRSEMPVRTVSQRFSHLQWRRLFKELWSRPTTTADIGSTFRQILHTSNFACWKIRFKIEVCTCSQVPTEAMQWIKEVDLFDSVDELRSSSSIRGIPMPNFEVLDARIASALNKFIHNSQFKRRISLEEQKAQKQDRFFRGRQIAYVIYEYFQVTGANDSVENYADLFTISLRNDDIQEFDSKWDGISLFMTKIPLDDILEGLYKLRVRGSEKLNTVLGLSNMEIHQKKIGPDNHRLKTMVKRSIEQDSRNRNFGARNGNYETWSRIKGQNSVDKEFLDIVGNGKPTGSVPKETIVVSVTILINVQKWHSRILLRVLSCSRMREMRREPEVPEEKVPVVECLDGRARITSKELAPIHPVKSGTRQNACSTRPRVVVGLGKSAHTHIVRLMNSRLKGPKRMMTKVQ